MRIKAQRPMRIKAQRPMRIKAQRPTGQSPMRIKSSDTDKIPKTNTVVELVETTVTQNHKNATVDEKQYELAELFCRACEPAS